MPRRRDLRKQWCCHQLHSNFHIQADRVRIWNCSSEHKTQEGVLKDPQVHLPSSHIVLVQGASVYKGRCKGNYSLPSPVLKSLLPSMSQRGEEGVIGLCSWLPGHDLCCGQALSVDFSLTSSSRICSSLSSERLSVFPLLHHFGFWTLSGAL